jgi:hypothetical protein
MSIEDYINKPDIASLWREFISMRDAMQLSRDRMLQIIASLRATDSYQTIASADEKKMVDESEGVLKDTMKQLGVL